MAPVSAILTAAGESTRMGTPKPLLMWHGVTLVEYQVANLLEGGVAEVVVVLGHMHEAVAPHVSGPNVRCVVNHDYRRGKTSSVLMGIHEVAPAAAGGILFLGVDQPCPSSIIRRIIDAHQREDALITSPYHGGHSGHPHVFSGRLSGELARITDAGQGIREVIERHRHEVNVVEIDDPIVRLDLNTPEQYEAARRAYGAG